MEESIPVMADENLMNLKNAFRLAKKNIAGSQYQTNENPTFQRS